ncbi:thiaminase II [Clostridium sp. LBM24168]
MEFVNELNESVMDIWNAYLEQPFVLEMANGTLPDNKMKWYLIEDSLFLKEYVKACSVAIFKANNMSDMALFSTIIEGIVQGEYALRDSYLSNAGIDKQTLENMEQSKESRDYSNYIIKTVLNGELPEIIASLLPCMLSYYYIGQQLIKQDSKCLDRRYGQVISEYVSEISLKNGKLCSDYMNKLCKYLDEQRKKKLFGIYRNVSIYELDFWNMLYKNRD